ncbi:nucleotidyl transferase AbiEii/AbiGii toxin family protein [Demequina capsici]|uniref:Nucleotidyl transferase AbiEii/AbiGii toxin family protein n=1 Tax=Demequina capsici TaxID=3075620 RepID=A0AA96FI59_9MICO|nr:MULTISPECIES: nucleotidyl transferase AbiEii/AbiGii toxin family protein [unclassified Demequina]WNM25900.1 nucleotidyl transferase AbiEii/AbiGii toxin family protein [Demequina sp. OYTSA14]WNM28796.1 nucleotidyl transferase AbiEii/AbiGii toxin family protein [Demequina sp. PMTSA13]
MNSEPYTSAAGVEAAIRDAARRASAADPSITMSDRIAQEHFRRFLSRVFSEADESGWVLKGGTGVLARVGSARTTSDVDLFRTGLSLEGALADLRQLAAVDLGDYFRFEYTGHRSSIGGQQAYADGYRVSFDVYVGANKRGALNVDLVVNVVITDDPTVTAPANRLHIPRLASHDYRLYPVVDQIADKVCATIAEYSGKPSTREWDLVDLVVLATTEDVDADKLRRSLVTEARVRGLEIPDRFTVPPSWGRRYAKDAKPVPACANYRTVALAAQLMNAFIDPVLRGEATGTWSHVDLGWK